MAATQQTLDKLLEVKRLRAEVRERRVAAWWNDPVQWIHDALPSVDIADYQEMELNALPEHGRVAARGPRGSGKTMPASLAVLWFATTRELAGVDWKIPTTAGSWNQLTNYLWPEIHKWARRLDWTRLGLSPWRLGSELLTLSIKGRTGEAFGKATDDPELIEGAHADHMLVVIDEGKSVVDGIWDAVEGFFSNPGEHYAFAISTPGAPVGRFYDIHARKPGYEDWHPIHVTIEQATGAGRVTSDWVEQREKQWGASSQLYRCHVLAEFAGEEDGVIPLAWVEAAIERGKLLDTSKLRPNRLGVDVADTGDDRSVIAWRDGWNIYQLRAWPSEGDVLLLGERAIEYSVKGSEIVVDSVGVGAGTYKTVDRAPQIKAIPFVASAKTKRRDSSNTFGFTNKRSAAWWNVRELLHPDGEPVTLPDEPELLGDLTAPRWREVAGGKIQVESKDDIRRRIGRSTDMGDAVVMVFWEEKTSRELAGLELGGLNKRPAFSLEG